MFINSDRQHLILKILLTTLLFGSVTKAAIAEDLSSYKAVVNSNGDDIYPDRELTLREAIGIVNGTLRWRDLSPNERLQVTKTEGSAASRIEFDFPAPVTIELDSLLPSLVSPGLVIDGTSHPDYDPNSTTTAEIAIPIPVVSLTPAAGKNLFRGLNIAGDRITVKGLSIYGFNQPHQPTDTLPGADIIVSSRLPTGDPRLQSEVPDRSPNNVQILDNWLGLPPDESLPAISSGFGVWIFDGKNTTVRGNRIYHHGGSGILTSVDAEGMQLRENIIVGNGLTGMPHAIYLEGSIADSEIADNLLCGNDGSGVYLFKPEGSTVIQGNQIKYNGRRVPSAAIYLIGNDHLVKDNQIGWQTGTGVTIAAYPQSDRNLIENNTFSYLEGLSIDLNTRHHTSKPFFKLGDGVNPPRNSRNRKRDTANRAINAPQFLSPDFYALDNRVNIDGVADPGATVSLYQVEAEISSAEPLALSHYSHNHGPLSKPIAETVADNEGRFSFTLERPTLGMSVSAIATQTNYGTSEPASNAVIKAIDGETPSPKPSVTIPACTTKPVAKVSPPPVVEAPPEPEPPPKPEPQPVRLKVPTNIHFALDKSDLSTTSQDILDRIATVLIEHPYLTIELQGYTDFRGSSQYNLALSKRRAMSTRNYFLQQGVAPERMTIIPMGESRLKKSGNNSLEHAYNRRVEIIFRDLRGLDIIFLEQDADLQTE